MPRVMIWDLPTRIFHWLLSSGFIAAAVLALLFGEHSKLFPYHAIIGLTMALMICLRVVWGLVGTRYARFGSFVFGPHAVLEYMNGVLLGAGKRHIGHNPGSAYAIFVMLALVLALAATGIMMGQGIKGVKELHEILAYVMVGVVVTHILGVLIHSFRHRENIIASMIHGKKEAEQSEAIRSSHPIIAIVFLAITAAWAFGLIRNYDVKTQTTQLPVFGASLEIGEAEDESGRRKESDDTRNRENDRGD